MALIPCPSCGAEISDQLKNCIVCGYSIPDLKGEYSKEKASSSSKQSFWTGFLLQVATGLAICWSSGFVDDSPGLSLTFFFVASLILLISLIRFLVFFFFFSSNDAGTTKSFTFLLGSGIGFVLGVLAFPFFVGVLLGKYPISTFDFWLRMFKK